MKMSFSPLVRGSMSAFCLTVATAAGAASLQVAPVSVEVAAPGATATMSLRNLGTVPLDAQIRVFRWTEVDGAEKLVPTDEVVASPPAMSIPANSEYTVRIVRTTKEPVSGEEAYRLFVDELPDASRNTGASVNLVLRYSIPVFFTPAGGAGAKLAWDVQRRDGRTYVVATNNGDRRVRISRLKIGSPKGTIASFGDGLVGYVLAHSTVQWVSPRSSRPPAVEALITADSDLGPISAQIRSTR